MTNQRYPISPKITRGDYHDYHSAHDATTRASNDSLPGGLHDPSDEECKVNISAAHSAGTQRSEDECSCSDVSYPWRPTPEIEEKESYNIFQGSQSRTPTPSLTEAKLPSRTPTPTPTPTPTQDASSSASDTSTIPSSGRRHIAHHRSRSQSSERLATRLAELGMESSSKKHERRSSRSGKGLDFIPRLTLGFEGKAHESPRSVDRRNNQIFSLDDLSPPLNPRMRSCSGSSGGSSSSGSHHRSSSGCARGRGATSGRRTYPIGTYAPCSSGSLSSSPPPPCSPRVSSPPHLIIPPSHDQEHSPGPPPLLSMKSCSRITMSSPLKNHLRNSSPPRLSFPIISAVSSPTQSPSLTFSRPPFNVLPTGPLSPSLSAPADIGSPLKIGRTITQSSPRISSFNFIGPTSSSPGTPVASPNLSALVLPPDTETRPSTSDGSTPTSQQGSKARSRSKKHRRRNNPGGHDRASRELESKDIPTGTQVADAFSADAFSADAFPITSSSSRCSFSTSTSAPKLPACMPFSSDNFAQTSSLNESRALNGLTTLGPSSLVCGNLPSQISPTPNAPGGNAMPPAPIIFHIRPESKATPAIPAVSDSHRVVTSLPSRRDSLSTGSILSPSASAHLPSRDAMGLSFPFGGRRDSGSPPMPNRDSTSLIGRSRRMSQSARRLSSEYEHEEIQALRRKSLPVNDFGFEYGPIKNRKCVVRLTEPFGGGEVTVKCSSDASIAELQELTLAKLQKGLNKKSSRGSFRWLSRSQSSPNSQSPELSDHESPWYQALTLARRQPPSPPIRTTPVLMPVSEPRRGSVTSMRTPTASIRAVLPSPTNEDDTKFRTLVIALCNLRHKALVMDIRAEFETYDPAELAKANAFVEQLVPKPSGKTPLLYPNPNDLEDCGKVICTPKGYESVMSFLSFEYSQENLEFWKAVTDLEWKFTRAEIPAVEIRRQAQALYHTFIDSCSVHTVNVSSATASAFRLHLQDPNIPMETLILLCVSAKDEIVRLLKGDSFRRYQESKLYKTFVIEARTYHAKLAKKRR